MSLQCGVQGLDEGINFNSQLLIRCPMSLRLSSIRQNGWPCQFHRLIRKRFSLMNLMVSKYCNWCIAFITSPWK